MPDSAVAPKWTHRQWLTRLSLRLVGVYLVVLCAMMWAENWLVYNPVRSRWHPPHNPATQEVWLALADGTPIHAWWQPVANAEGTVLFLHGKGGNVSLTQGLEGFANEWPVNSLVVDYPGFGKSGGKPCEVGCYAAADAGYDWLTQVQNVPAAEVVIVGTSLGGAVAVDVASRRPHRALVLVKTFDSLPNVAARLYPWLPVHAVMRNRFHSIEKIAACTRPIFVVHGTADTLVPYDSGLALFTAAQAPKQLVTLPGKGHFGALGRGLAPQLQSFLSIHAPLRQDQ